jgi:hypothetical protein
MSLWQLASGWLTRNMVVQSQINQKEKKRMDVAGLAG